MDHKGIAVIAASPYGLRPGAVAPELAHSFLACTVSGPREFNLLAVWAHPKPTYAGAIWSALDVYKEWIGERPTVIVGDFNSHSRFDRAGVEPTHGALEERLREEFGLVSAWHAAHAGAPEPGTFYRRYNGEPRPFHIDYCFIPQTWTPSLTEVSIAAFEEYNDKSDHRPLVIDVDL